MPRLCHVCTHPDRLAIEAEILAGVDSKQRIATKYGLKEPAIRRHRDGHMTKAVAAARESAVEEEKQNGRTVLERLEDIQRHVISILEGASNEPRLSLQAIAEARKNLELMAKLLGELDTRPVNATQVNVGVGGDGSTPISVVIRAMADEEVR